MKIIISHPFVADDSLRSFCFETRRPYRLSSNMNSSSLDPRRCASFQVQSMAKSNASGVLVYAFPGNPIQDMNCVKDECNTTLNIPAAMVHVEDSVAQALQ